MQTMHAQQRTVCMHTDCRTLSRSRPGLSIASGGAYGSFRSAQKNVKSGANRLRKIQRNSRHTCSSLRRGRPQIAATVKTDTQTRSKPADSQQTNGWAWLFGALTLTSGAAIPGLYLASHWQQFIESTPQQRTTGILTIDGIFIVAATVFLYCGHQFGVQRHGKTPRFPGPMVEQDGTRRTPDFFAPYFAFIALTSLLTPAAGLGFLVWQGQADLGISTLGSYVLCAFVQVASESISLRLGTPMWVQVPQAYQPYRMWQLARGLALSTAVGGPEWLQTLQGYLLVLWVFNYGAQMTFTPWLYRWHLQPKDS